MTSEDWDISGALPMFAGSLTVGAGSSFEGTGSGAGDGRVTGGVGVWVGEIGSTDLGESVGVEES